MLYCLCLQEDRQTRLREHARRLIAETRAKSLTSDSPVSPSRSITQRITLTPDRSPITGNDSKENSPTKNGMAASSRLGGPRDSENNRNSPGHAVEKNGNASSLQSFNSVLESISPQRERKVCYF